MVGAVSGEIAELQFASSEVEDVCLSSPRLWSLVISQQVCEAWKDQSAQGEAGFSLKTIRVEVKTEENLGNSLWKCQWIFTKSIFKNHQENTSLILEQAPEWPVSLDTSEETLSVLLH